jgi:hypothetical protein
MRFAKQLGVLDEGIPNVRLYHSVDSSSTSIMSGMAFLNMIIIRLKYLKHLPVGDILSKKEIVTRVRDIIRGDLLNPSFVLYFQLI